MVPLFMKSEAQGSYSAESHTTCKQPSWNLDLDQSEFMSFQGLVLLGLVCSRYSISVLSLVCHSRVLKEYAE